MTIAEIEEEVRRYVLDSFLQDTSAGAFSNADDLFALLDSLQVLRLVVQLEALFGVQVTDADLTAENLSSVERVARFVARRLSEGSEHGHVRPGSA